MGCTEMSHEEFEAVFLRTTTEDGIGTTIEGLRERVKAVKLHNSDICEKCMRRKKNKIFERQMSLLQVMATRGRITIGDNI